MTELYPPQKAAVEKLVGALRKYPAATAAERKQITAAARAACRGRKLTPAHRRALSESKKRYWANWRRQKGLT